MNLETERYLISKLLLAKESTEARQSLALVATEFDYTLCHVPGKYFLLSDDRKTIIDSSGRHPIRRYNANGIQRASYIAQNSFNGIDTVADVQKTHDQYTLSFLPGIDRAIADKFHVSSAWDVLLAYCKQFGKQRFNTLDEVNNAAGLVIPNVLFTEIDGKITGN